MSDMNDCSYEKSSVTENDVNNEYIRPITGFGGFDSSNDKQGQDDGFPQSVSSNLSSLSKNLQVLAEKLKFWSSKFVVREGDVMIDISLAAKGMSSTVPEGAQQQTLPYPGTFYRFDPCIFHGQNTELDLDQAANLNLVENRLYALMKLPSTVDGCTIVMKQHSLKVTCHRRWSWIFLCSHGMIMREIQDSHFGPNSVGKLNVSVQIQNTIILKERPSEVIMKFGSQFYFIQSYFSDHYLSCIVTGVDAMVTKEVKNCMICENYKKRKLRETDQTPWKTVSRQAPSINKKCSMTITIFLGLDNHFYLSKKFMSQPLLPSTSKIKIHSTWTKRHGHRRL
jgi:hypothetical protein